jgi:hypothetical protein
MEQDLDMSEELRGVTYLETFQREQEVPHM